LKSNHGIRIGPIDDGVSYNRGVVGIGAGKNYILALKFYVFVISSGRDNDSISVSSRVDRVLNRIPGIDVISRRERTGGCKNRSCLDFPQKFGCYVSNSNSWGSGGPFRRRCGRPGWRSNSFFSPSESA